MMRVLVAYGTKMGGTAGIAEMVGDALTAAGLQVDVRSASERADIGTYDAVIVGGALYNNRWHRHARRFVKRHTDLLRTRPVWLFSSGLLDDSAATGEIEPVAQVQQLLRRVGARGHVTFGGRLAPRCEGLPRQLDGQDPRRRLARPPAHPLLGDNGGAGAEPAGS
jgi:menaquinone-dependent protoporphyrinogen oxidase